MTAYQSNLPSLEELLSNICVSRKITMTDFNLLSLLIEYGSPNQEQIRIVQRALYSIRRGWIVLVGVPNDGLYTLQLKLKKVQLSHSKINPFTLCILPAKSDVELSIN